MTTLPRSVERRARTMAAMMRHLGIWPKISFEGLPMESAIRTCFLCRKGGLCGRWLAVPQTDPLAWQRFCPNAELFARLMRRISIDVECAPAVPPPGGAGEVWYRVTYSAEEVGDSGGLGRSPLLRVTVKDRPDERGKRRAVERATEIFETKLRNAGPRGPSRPS